MEWTECFSKSRQRPYWFNTKTGESLWKMPDNFYPKRKASDISDNYRPSKPSKCKRPEQNEHPTDTVPSVHLPAQRSHVVDFQSSDKDIETPKDIKKYKKHEQTEQDIDFQNAETIRSLIEVLDKIEPTIPRPSLLSPKIWSPRHNYDRLEEQTYEERNRSKSIFLRKFNNWIKTVLFTETVEQFRKKNGRDPLRIADFACGRGGDILKWSFCNIQYYLGVDISVNSLEKARIRYNEKKLSFEAEFRCYDLRCPIAYSPSVRYDIISMQFAIHYMFESEQTFRTFMETVSRLLCDGGYFIFTTIDVLHIKRLLNYKDTYLRRLSMLRSAQRSVKHYESVAQRTVKQSEVWSEMYQPENNESLPKTNYVIFETNVMKLQIEQQLAHRWKTTDCLPFGSSYVFTLADAVHECSEYAADPRLFTPIMEEYNVYKVLDKDFISYYYDYANQYMDLFKEINVNETSGEWHTAECYCVYVFRKKTQTPS